MLIHGHGYAGIAILCLWGGQEVMGYGVGMPNVNWRPVGVVGGGGGGVKPVVVEKPKPRGNDAIYKTMIKVIGMALIIFGCLMMCYWLQFQGISEHAAAVTSTLIGTSYFV